MANTDFQFGHNDPDAVQPEKRECFGLMICPHCGNSAMCNDVQKQNGENNMIPRSEQRIGDDGNSTSRNGKKKSKGFRYLTTDMLSNSHVLATIVDARLQPDNFKPGTDCVVAKLKFKGEFVLWTLRNTNPCLEILGDAFGDDETTWKNREIELFTEEDGFDGKKWIRVDPVTKSSTTKKK